MLQKILGIVLLVVVILIALSIFSFIFSIIWKIGVVALVMACGYFGWKLIRK